MRHYVVPRPCAGFGEVALGGEDAPEALAVQLAEGEVEQLDRARRERRIVRRPSSNPVLSSP
jgi:hypothetical protein